MAARGHAHRPSPSRVSDKEDEMRAIDCPCGHRLEGADDQARFRRECEQVNRHQPERRRSCEQIRDRVAAVARASARAAGKGGIAT